MINTYLKDILRLKFLAGTDSWGTPLPRTWLDTRGFIERKTKRVTSFKGEEVVASISVLVFRRPEIDHTTVVEIDEAEWTIMSIEEQRDFVRRYLILWLNPAVTK